MVPSAGDSTFSDQRGVEMCCQPDRHREEELGRANVIHDVANEKKITQSAHICDVCRDGLKVSSEKWRGGRSGTMGRWLVRGLVIGLGTQLGFPFFVSGRVQEIFRRRWQEPAK